MNNPFIQQTPEYDETIPSAGVCPEAHKTSSGDLEYVWKSRMARVAGGRIQRPLTASDRRCLRFIVKRVGSQAVEIIEYALQNWPTFSRKAAARAGSNSCPAVPNISFLANHCEVAARLLQADRLDATAAQLQSALLQELQERDRVRLLEEATRRARLDEQNEKDVANMIARFTAVGEPVPEVTYNDHGEVIFRATKKDWNDLCAGVITHHELIYGRDNDNNPSGGH
jgi:hypothetical protein